MLKCTLMIVLLSWLSYGLQAQNVFTVSNSTEVPSFDFDVREETRQMERATANAFVLSWPQADPKMVSKAWKKYAKGLDGKLDYNRRANEYFVDNGEVDGLSDNSVDITAKVSESGEGAELAIWFNLGVTYLNSRDYPERYQAAEALLRDFDSFVYAELMRDQIKAEEKQLRQMERDLKKMERQKKREERDIKRAQRDMEKAQKEIDESEREIADYNKHLDEKKALEARQEQLIDQMKTKIKSVR